MNWQRIIIDKDFAFSRISCLVILLLSALTGMILVICPYIESFFSESFSKWVSLGLVLFVEVIIVVFWIYHRTVFPKGSKKTQNIVIAITTEDDKQKNRIKKDFTSNIKSHLNKYHLNSDFDVIVLHNHLSKEARQRIEKIAYLKKTGENFQETEEAIKFQKLSNRLNAKFFIFGDLISRNSPNNEYFLKTNALLNHNRIDVNTGRTFQNEFNNLWKTEINP